MPLPDSQFWGMRADFPLLQLSFHWWPGQWGCCNCPGYQGFLPEGLWLTCTVPHHHDCLLTALPQLCVCILYGEALWQRAISSP